MTRKSCPETTPDCKYYPRCFSDEHHVFGQARAKATGRIALEFTRLPENVERLCRAEHDQIHQGELPPFPDITLMKLAILEHRNGTA